MSDADRTAPAGAATPDGFGRAPAEPDMEAAMSAALAPVVARASNGGTSAPAAPPGEATMMMDKKVGEEAAPMRSMPAEPAHMDAPHAGVPMRDRVYEHLVEGDDDVIGLITYSLYEQDKREWLAGWHRQHGKDPRPDQLEAFVTAQLTFAQRDRYRTAARQVLDAYASVAVDLEKPLIIRDGVAGRVEDAARKVEASARWWRQLPAVLAGAVIAAAIVIGVVVILVAAGVDIAGYLGFEQAAGG